MDKDIDPVETFEWLESINYIIRNSGVSRAKFILNRLFDKIKYLDNNFSNKKKLFDYVNSISLIDQVKYPGDIEIENNILNYVRWNAIMLVLRSTRKRLDLGGHISSYQSFSSIYEVCFNHFFKIYNKNSEDLIFFQGHSSPGIYSRSYLEGRITDFQMNNFRQEVVGGLSSYPHPYLMPNFWQFPTVSMGLGPLCSIYQAKFLKFLMNRGIKDTSNQKIYVFIGDGEMDEAESKGLINIAVREKLNNLIFIVNCNLQRLDGPVFGNGKIIDELSNLFFGVGWKVIRVIWDSNWDKLFLKDISGKLIKLVNETLDGDYQNIRSKSSDYLRNNFFGKYIETFNLVSNLSDYDLYSLNYGGHDFKKIYSAIFEAYNSVDKPSVIFFKTVKGYGLGRDIECSNDIHQIKLFDFNRLKLIRDNLSIPIDNKKLNDYLFVSFKKKSKEYDYLHFSRNKLGGYLPRRRKFFTKKIILPNKKKFIKLLGKSLNKTSTTLCFNKILNILLNDKNISYRIVPIISDGARTFGIESFFHKFGIYSSFGQNYDPEDINKLLFYKEDKKGQILQEGINELGAFASWIAASTSYSVNDIPMIPFYIHYSMFGFSRFGDLLWSAGDQCSRGFLIGGVSGKTTLNGEGLQHQDGNSHVYYSTVSNCISYDPAFSYELLVIILNNLEKMYGVDQDNFFVYISLYNEMYYMPEILNNIEDGICKGAYKFKTFVGSKSKIQLLSSGSMINSVLKAADYLSFIYDISVDVFSVTSFTELARDGSKCFRWNMLHPDCVSIIPYISSILDNSVTVACTDYVKLYAEQIRPYVLGKYYVLGTDGYGKSDSRDNLRSYFEVSYPYIILSSLNLLYIQREISIKLLFDVINKFNINVNLEKYV